MNLFLSEALKEAAKIPNLEVFKSNYSLFEIPGCEVELSLDSCDDDYLLKKGGILIGQGKDWFYWICLPGCLPDSNAFGPFETENDALNDAINTFRED